MALTQLKTGAIADDAVTTDKLANAINTERTANTAKVSLDADSVTGAKIADDAVGAEHIEQLDADLSFADNAKAKFGTGNDLELYHDGSHTRIDNQTGALFLRNNTGTYNGESIKIQPLSGEESIVCNPNGDVELYHDNSKKLETTSGGINVTGNVKADGIRLDDDDEIRVGTGDDLKIYHDGSTNIIDGQFHPIELRHQSEVHIKCTDDGAVDLYHNNSKKVQTESAGITVFGSTQVDGTCHPYSDNASDLGLSGNRWQDLYLSGNIYIGGTGSANGLSDYEEGTFTPQLAGFSSISYHRQDGFYTKIGRQVWMHVYLYVYQATGNSNKIRITNLPFTSSSANSGYIRHGGTLWYQNDTFKSSFNSESKPHIYIDQGSTEARFVSQAGSELNGEDTHLGGGANNRYIICGLQMIV